MTEREEKVSRGASGGGGGGEELRVSPDEEAKGRPASLGLRSVSVCTRSLSRAVVTRETAQLLERDRKRGWLCRAFELPLYLSAAV